jgi:hypothetical protein
MEAAYLVTGQEARSACQHGTAHLYTDLSGPCRVRLPGLGRPVGQVILHRLPLHVPRARVTGQAGLGEPVRLQPQAARARD